MVSYALAHTHTHTHRYTRKCNDQEVARVGRPATHYKMAARQWESHVMLLSHDLATITYTHTTHTIHTTHPNHHYTDGR